MRIDGLEHVHLPSVGRDEVADGTERRAIAKSESAVSFLADVGECEAMCERTQ